MDGTNVLLSKSIPMPLLYLMVGLAGAIYTGILVAGMAYALFRRRARPLPWWVFLLLTLPITIDGGTQLIGLRESDWLLRTATGALFGMAAVWLLYPYIQEAMAEVLESELARRAARPR